MINHLLQPAGAARQDSQLEEVPALTSSERKHGGASLKVAIVVLDI